MIKLRPKHIIIFLVYALILSWNFNAYSADSEKSNADKEITINLTNFSEKGYLEYLFPLLPSHGYIFNRNYLHDNSISNPSIGIINFYEGKNTIDNKEFYRLSANAFDKNKTPFILEWDISNGFLGYSLDNRKTEAFKFTAEMIFNSEDNDINAVFAKKLIESDNIINVNPLYLLINDENDEVEKINGYEFNYTLKRSSTYRAVRTAGEILGVISLGVANYFMTREVNSADWQYGYSWYDAKHKFIDGWYWDPNNFNTNTVYHLYAGATYYMIGRSNGYSILESFGWSVFGSTMWEYFGEWREQVSFNDMIFTPTLGALTGEFFVQSANFVERKMKPGFLRSTISFILYPFGTINRALDSSNSGDMRVRLIFANPLQTAVERKIEKDIFNR